MIRSTRPLLAPALLAVSLSLTAQAPKRKVTKPAPAAPKVSPEAAQAADQAFAEL